MTTWTLIIDRPGKDRVTRDYNSWGQATDAMIIAMDKMTEPVELRLTNPDGIVLAVLKITPEGYSIGDLFFPVKVNNALPPNTAVVAGEIIVREPGPDDLIGQGGVRMDESGLMP